VWWFGPADTASSPVFIQSVTRAIVCLQVDAAPWDSLSAEDRATIEAMGAEAAKLSSGGEP
jgi:hypothetical protein